jgi:CheY-like chemotaxis protein
VIVLLIEPSHGLRQLYGAELWCAGYAVRAVTSWDEALEALHGPPTPALMVLDASIERGQALQFVREVRANARLRTVPIVAIAFAPGSESGILEAGVQCCLRLLPTPADVLKAVRWAEAVYVAPEGEVEPPPQPFAREGCAQAPHRARASGLRQAP